MRDGAINDVEEFLDGLGEIDDPDVSFTLAAAAPEDGIDAQIKELTRRIATELAASAPPGWQRLDALFALTVADGVAQVFYTNAGQVVRAEPSEPAVLLAREHRDLTADLDGGPWWRMVLGLTSGGELRVDYDFGAEPFPDGQLLAPAAYRADLAEYPRERLPVWLAAYIGHADRQSRTPQRAAASARADLAADVAPVLTENEFPPLPAMWSRWVTLSAAFVAAESRWGPRMLPSLGWFEGATRSGSTLYLLPGGRAVLSGGRWDAPELDAAYNLGLPMPDLYRGAPYWVANPVLNPRAANGLLSFCYWWDGGSWYRGESPSPDRFSDAMPGVWTASTVIDLVAKRAGDQQDPELRDAAIDLLTAAEAGAVTREAVARVFADAEAFDIDGALYQFATGGLVAPEFDSVTAAQATDLVRRYLALARLDTGHYPPDQLVAERLDVGWLVHVPPPAAAVVLDRAVFYVADDGVVERSAASVPTSTYAAGFAARYRRRRR